jgi:magnesium transporter
LELEQLATEYHVPHEAVQDCLNPSHLPKCEVLEDGTLFVIIRAFDHRSSNDDVGMKEMTGKLALFVRKDFLLTIHRRTYPFLESDFGERTGSPLQTAIAILKKAVITWEEPLEASERKVEQLESLLHRGDGVLTSLVTLHSLRSRLATLKRLAIHTLSVVQKIPIANKKEEVALRDLRETVDGLLFFSDELLEDATSLINLELGAASQRTNQVIRVLTIFSVFFMPLTFIVGIYGMNFEHMPELRSPWGYVGVWIAMTAVTISIALWFRMKRWI